MFEREIKGKYKKMNLEVKKISAYQLSKHNTDYLCWVRKYLHDKLLSKRSIQRRNLILIFHSFYEILK